MSSVSPETIDVLVLKWKTASGMTFSREADIHYALNIAAKLADWAVERMESDRAEREERERPIDAEWCLANGVTEVVDSRMYRWRIGAIRVEWAAYIGVTIDDGDNSCVCLPLLTCGAFGDLLRVLKGGAE